MMDGVLFRDAAVSDLDRLADLEQICFSAPWTRGMLQDELANPHARYVVCCRENVIVAYGGYWCVVDEAHVTNIAVAPDVRRYGLGTALLQKMIDMAVAEGLAAMTLEVRQNNEIAKSLYAKFGFVAIGVRPRYYPDGENALILWKRDMRHADSGSNS